MQLDPCACCAVTAQQCRAKEEGAGLRPRGELGSLLRTAVARTFAFGFLFYIHTA